MAASAMPSRGWTAGLSREIVGDNLVRVCPCWAVASGVVRRRPWPWVSAASPRIKLHTERVTTTRRCAISFVKQLSRLSSPALDQKILIRDIVGHSGTCPISDFFFSQRLAGIGPRRDLSCMRRGFPQARSKILIRERRCRRSARSHARGAALRRRVPHRRRACGDRTRAPGRHRASRRYGTFYLISLGSTCRIFHIEATDITPGDYSMAGTWNILRENAVTEHLTTSPMWPRPDLETVVCGSSTPTLSPAALRSLNLDQEVEDDPDQN